MRIIFTILSFWCFQVKATIYYVSNAGSNAANGTSTGTSWQTIAKVNATIFSPGDQILFKAGDSWNERLNITVSGTAGNVITFGSYGTGLKPIITGFQTASGLTTSGGNIWTATLSNSVPNLNMVLINGAIAHKARYPNTTYLLTNAGSSTTVINTALIGTPNYTGGELVIYPLQYVSDITKILSQSGGALTVNEITSSSSGNNPFFIQNLPSLLDMAGEYTYDSASKLFSCYASSLPTVQYSTKDTLVNNRYHDYITFDGLNITGSNMLGLGIDTAHHVTIQNCNFNYSGSDAITRSGSMYNTIQNDTIQNSFTRAIWTTWRSDNSLIDNNYIKNTGMIPGMNYSGNLTSMGMHAYGKFGVVSNNRIDSTGYNAIYFNGDTSLIYRNYITNFCQNKGDGGGIYTYAQIQAGSIVRSNIILNGLTTASPCIYLDDNSHYITVDSNTVYNGFRYCVQFNHPNHIEFHDNTIIDSLGCGVFHSVTGNITNLNFTRNIIYIKDSVQPVMNLWYGSSQIFTSTMDSNYFLRPIKEAFKFEIGVINTYYSLADWTAATGFEAHSHETPAGITSAGTLYYNATLTNSTIPLTGSYKSAKGVTYTGSVTIPPFQSIILFPIISPGTTGRIGNLNFQ